MTSHPLPRTTADHHHHGHVDDAVLAELLDLDAELLVPLLDEVLDWTALHVREIPRTVVDVGAGTGTGTRALARRFPSAQVVAIDRSEAMLERLRAAAQDAGLGGRVRAVPADLDTGWPAVSGIDLAWAASFLHEATDPARVLRDLHAALEPGGLLVVVEIDALPRFLPDDAGIGRPGLEARCHELLARMGWNAHPDWRPVLEQAGFRVVGHRRFGFEASAAPTPTPTPTGRYAHAWLRHIRSALVEPLDGQDLAALDRLLDDDDPAAVLHREDLTLRAGRLAWAARRA